MPAYEVVVQWKDGSKATSKRVVVGTRDGMSSAVLTDRNGRAVVQTSGFGEKLYVDGKDCGKPRTGTNLVTIR